MIRIATDSTADLSRDLLEKYKINVIPLIVTLGENDFLDNGVDVTESKIFSFVKENKILPKTAARSIEDYIDFFKGLLKEEDDKVVYIGLSSELSSSFNNARMASQEIGEDRVFTVDSKSLSSGIGLLAIEAAKMVEKGYRAEEIVSKIEAQREKNQASFVVDKLDYLYKGGRCSKFSFSIGALLKIKPKLQLVDGKIINTGKDMGGLKQVLKKYVDSTLAKYPNVRKDICFVTHTEVDEEISKFIFEYVKSLGVFDEVIEQTAGSVITSHCGPGTLGILYLYN